MPFPSPSWQNSFVYLSVARATSSRDKRGNKQSRRILTLTFQHATQNFFQPLPTLNVSKNRNSFIPHKIDKFIHWLGRSGQFKNKIYLCNSIVVGTSFDSSFDGIFCHDITKKKSANAGVKLICQSHLAKKSMVKVPRATIQLIRWTYIFFLP